MSTYTHNTYVYISYYVFDFNFIAINRDQIFSVDNLCRDTYLRSFMDEAGYIPIAFVCNFPNIICYGADYQLIIKYLMESSYIEVDIVNETMRLKEGWEQVSLN